MILQGSTCSSIAHARKLAMHLQGGENERVIIAEHPEAMHIPLSQSFADMQIMTKATKGRTGLFHVAINPDREEAGKMNEANWRHCIQSIEKNFGLSKQPRAIVLHEKNGRNHVHVVWQLTDMEKCKIIDHFRYKKRLQKVAQQLEKDLGHKLTQRNKSGKNYDLKDSRAAQERGEALTPRQRKELIAELWNKHKNGYDFVKAANENGYVIAKGDKTRGNGKANYVVMHKGSMNVVGSLTRELPKEVRIKEVRLLLDKLDLHNVSELQHVEKVKANNKELWGELVKHHFMTNVALKGFKKEADKQQRDKRTAKRKLRLMLDNMNTLPTSEPSIDNELSEQPKKSKSLDR